MERFRGGEAASNAAAAAASLSGAPASKGAAAREACRAVPPAAASAGAAPLPTYSTETANRLPQEGTSSSSDCHNRSSSSVGHSCFSSHTAPACSRCVVLAAEAKAAAAAAAAARGGAGEAASPIPRLAVVAPALPFTSTTVSLLQQGHGSSSSKRDQYNRDSSSCQISGSSSSRAAVSSCTNTTGTSSTAARGDIQGDVLAETVSDMMCAAGLSLDLGKLLCLALENQKGRQDDVGTLNIRERLELKAERSAWQAERVMLISQMLELQAEIESKGAAWRCPVCITHEVDVVFTGCGHIFYSTCSSSLRSCAICRKNSRVQNMYRA